MIWVAFYVVAVNVDIIKASAVLLFPVDLKATLVISIACVTGYIIICVIIAGGDMEIKLYLGSFIYFFLTPIFFFDV